MYILNVGMIDTFYTSQNNLCFINKHLGTICAGEKGNADIQCGNTHSFELIFIDLDCDHATILIEEWGGGELGSESKGKP